MSKSGLIITLIMMSIVGIFYLHQIEEADMVYEQCIADGKKDYECKTHAYGHFGRR